MLELKKLTAALLLNYEVGFSPSNPKVERLPFLTSHYHYHDTT
jgi:hypothetical protein